MQRFGQVIVSAALALCLVFPGVVAADEDRETLREEIARMQAQLQAMQQRLDELESEQVETAERMDAREESVEGLAEVVEEDKAGVEFGGAMRLNYAWRDYDPQNKDRLGDFELELFRINMRGEVGDVILDAEWRRYNDFQAIHHAWVGYRFNEQLHAELGITQVPFGILPFASHSFWFGGTYYLGYEDDYDTGLKFVHKPSDDWTFHYAFFNNPEYANDSRADRYSFDLVTGGDQQNAESNQFNLRAERHLTLSEETRLDLGVSLQAGQLYNRATERNGDRWATALHMDAYHGDWNGQLQWLRYEYSPENPEGVSGDFVQRGAFGFPFMVAGKADVYSANLARSFALDFGPVTGAQCYNNFTFIDPRVDNSAESVQNVTGCSISAGGLFTYVDWIAGRNMWFAGGDGIGLDGATAGKWRSRLNINLGFYF